MIQPEGDVGKSRLFIKVKPDVLKIDGGRGFHAARKRTNTEQNGQPLQNRFRRRRHAPRRARRACRRLQKKWIAIRNFVTKKSTNRISTEATTTACVVERPTPSVPPRVVSPK